MLRLIIVISLCVLAFGAGVSTYRALPPDNPIKVAARVLSSDAKEADQLARIEVRLYELETISADRSNPSPIEIAKRLQALEDAVAEALELNLKMLETQ